LVADAQPWTSDCCARWMLGSWKGCRSHSCVIGGSSLSRAGNARECDLGLGRNAKSRSVSCRQPGWEMLHILGIAGVIVGGVCDQHRNLDNAIEPAACRVEDFGDELKRVPDLFGGGIAPIDSAAGIVRSRRSRYEYEASGFGGPAERSARARFRQADEVDHGFDSFELQQSRRVVRPRLAAVIDCLSLKGDPTMAEPEQRSRISSMNFKPGVAQLALGGEVCAARTVQRNFGRRCRR
jgi:hypothetical protein